MKVDSLLVLPPQDSKVLKKVGCVSLIRIPSGSLLLLVSEYVPQGDGRRPGVAVQGLKCITYGGGVCELSLTVPVITANAESMRHDAVSRQEKSTKMLNISNFFQRTRLCVTWENSGQRCNNELCVFVLKPTGSSLPWQRLSLSLFCWSVLLQERLFSRQESSWNFVLAFCGFAVESACFELTNLHGCFCPWQSSETRRNQKAW